MYRRLSMVMFPILLVALIGTGVWGYTEHQEKNSILIKAENQYQRAFHDLSFHMDKLKSELGNALAVHTASTDSYRKGLVNVWRLTSEAQNEINQLPLSLMEFNKTEEFLSKLAKFSYGAAVRDLNKKPLSKEEMKTLSSLYEHSNEISNELRGVQGKVIANRLRWMDVELALASDKQPEDNTIIDGFQTVDKKVSNYNELSTGVTSMSLHTKRDVSVLTGKEMTPGEIQQKAAKFSGLPAEQIKVNENGNASEYQSLSANAMGASGESVLQMDFTKKGGELIYFMKPREVKETKLSVREARDKANEFLDQHGYPNMTAVSFDKYGNTANITFARKIDDIVYYPQKLVTTVALDNGELTGMQTTDYVFSKKDQIPAKPKLSLDEARKKLNSNLKVVSDGMAVIKDQNDKDVMCYEFIGNMNDQSYRVYINGDLGTEEKIETIRKEDVEASK
ncbi:germination protein YpeB [Paenibacillus larvae]|uniref:Sporulation protein YpeB n=5 Tax=Paenibacillus larvae TaxID=1464 RepID=A0A2L1TRU6_9BACL|nr:germination protein YpeB [Paenibacillus larvae]AQR79412.1 germination protein YpeB [Paenibacillus larvae subsp. larvae]AQT86232.1 germination protein YpeB [Paenibacillus larvae subsp. pulvifaciens]AQZ47860.1 germination protein YpeB [Paenibacillus larvae subsp. pulvifaciens]ARF69618.1 germination protein YpeB [Paenibacillus larvae subsp. pulvifaciens]AVF23408.1 sporulation protein YpeB [Paenibacillus larvae subsp. larvae]